MPLTSYCKKCACDVPVGESCPHCKAKLAAGSVRLAWCVDHTPVRDWMCWNAVMRIALPVLGLMLLIVFVVEFALGGIAGVTGLLTGGLFPTLAWLSLGALALLLLLFILQGDDLLDCVVDSTGIHVQQYLLRPTALKLLLRLKSPQLLGQAREEGVLLISTQEIGWKDIRRVQLWHEKGLVLFYAPAWWQRLSLPCTRETWLDALSFIREKIGKRKDVILPPECINTAPAAKKPRKTPVRTQQLTIEDVPPQPIPEEEVPPPADWTQDAPPPDITA